MNVDIVIIPQVSLLPDSDQWSETKSELLAQMDVCMGGRVAEELIFGPDNITTGASSDFEQATQIAHLMVTKFGMSEKVSLFKAVFNNVSTLKILSCMALHAISVCGMV